MQDEVPIIKTRRRYSLETKRNVLRELSDHTQQRVADLSGIPLRKVKNFVREKEKIWASLHAKRQFHIGEPSRPEILPGGDDLLDYMVAMREKHFPLTTYHVVQQVKANNQEWKGSDASISHADKSCRLTAVLAAKHKLPILFVVKGKPGGFIDKNAWIDGDGWNFYLDTILRPSLILIDNFDAHTTPRNAFDKAIPRNK
ncbi:hypothetical protein Ae201684P_002103 [Aphanomyces euteiches]|nr:hypothetical protein Ae201684P_002103 [Aphanomyces euteiches]